MINGTRKPTAVRGFTLIEILIVTAIMGIGAAIAILSIGSGRTVREVEAGAREFSSILREAQNGALTGKVLVANTDPCGYRVTWDNGASSYRLTYLYVSSSGGSGCSASPSSSTVAEYSMRGNVRFSVGGSVTYRPPHATGVAADTRVTISKASISRSICVRANGRVDDQASSCP